MLDKNHFSIISIYFSFFELDINPSIWIEAVVIQNHFLSLSLSRSIQHSRVILIIERQIERGMPLDRGHDWDAFEPKSILSTYHNYAQEYTCM